MSHFLLRVECASSGPQGPSPPCPADPLRNAVWGMGMGMALLQASGSRNALKQHPAYLYMTGMRSLNSLELHRARFAVRRPASGTPQLPAFSFRIDK
jgi:hypothetical protein